MTLPSVIFVVPQAQAAANGGIASISYVISGLRHHRAIIVTDGETERVDGWRSQGIETHVLPQALSSGLTRAPMNVLASYGRYTNALRRLIRESGAKVVHANDPTAFQLALAAVKLSRGTSIVLNLRDTIDPARTPPRLRFRLLFRAADHVLYLSKDMADRWAKIASGAKRACSVTYSVVDLERFAPAAPYSGAGPPVALLSGIIRHKKGQLEFLRHVSPMLAAEGIETWLAGDFDPARNGYMRACAEAAEPLGDSVNFLGYRTDVPELIGRSAVVAVASRHEGLVRSMIEAMSCARPVVSFDVCSAREILEEQSGGAGIVVHSGDYAAMAEAIVRYCRNATLSASAGEKGSAAANRLFAGEGVVRRYEQVYEMFTGRA